MAIKERFKLKIFFVEDSDILRARLIRELSKIPGVESVGEADTADEAIAAIRIQKPDLVLLDIRLRLGNGISVLTAIKEDESPPIVIVFTGYPDPPYRERCLKEGADYFFSKKDEYEKVFEVVKKLSQQV